MSGYTGMAGDETETLANNLCEPEKSIMRQTGDQFRRFDPAWPDLRIIIDGSTLKQDLTRRRWPGNSYHHFTLFAEEYWKWL